MTDDSLQITIRLTPKAARNAVQGWAADASGAPVLKASVTTVPEKGKANAALIALLSKSWRIPKSHIALVRGETDRNKVVRITGLTPAQKNAILSEGKD